MVFIRADANDYIATGHIMRCRTIAYRLAELGEKVEFLVSDEESTKLLENSGIGYRVLGTDWNNPDNEHEIGIMKAILGNYSDTHKQKPRLLIDSYLIDAQYTYKLRDYASIIVIDDLFEHHFAADLVINYTLHYDMYDYHGRYGNTARLCLGGKYAPLRQQFSGVRPKTVRSGDMDVLVICGGGDTLNSLTGIVRQIADMHEICNNRYHIVAGAYNPYIDDLRDLERKYSWMTLYDNVSNMAELMGQCDIAVSAASTVLYECCAMQLPTIYYIVADNQKNTEKCFVKNQMMIYAGDMRCKPDETRRAICSAVKTLGSKPELRVHMQKEMAKVVDGNGALRIAQKIMEV